MPSNRYLRAQGVTVHRHEGLAPTKRQETQEALIKKTEAMVNHKVGAYMKKHGKDVHWATRVRAYYTHLITGQSLPGLVKIDEETRQLVRGWVDEARRTTGLQPPRRATAPKGKRKKKR